LQVFSHVFGDNEIEIVFLIASIFTCLWCYHRGSKNLDLLVLLIKNWLNESIIGFEAKGRPLKSVDEFGDTKEEILDLLDTEFVNEVEGYVEECVHNWDIFP
jgi:hypothetical protein